MITELMHQYLREIHIDQKDVLNPKSFPFNLEAIKSLKSLVLHPNVTFLIGENGTGKSTLLEAIAVAYGFNPEGGSRILILLLRRHILTYILI